MTDAAREVREYVARLSDAELDAALQRQLSVRVRAAAERERDSRHVCGRDFYTYCDGCRAAYRDAGLQP